MRRVITFGTYDVFHVGHLHLLERAARLGDALMVGVSSDELNIRKKGVVPSVPLADRMRIVAALRCVNDVFIEESLEAKRQYVIERGAHVLVMGDDWQGRFDFLSDVCDIVYLPRTPGISSTELKTTITQLEMARLENRVIKGTIWGRMAMLGRGSLPLLESLRARKADL